VLQGKFKGHLVQPPCSEQGHLQLDQVAQTPVQPDLECFQGCGIYQLSGQIFPVFHHPYHCKKFLPHKQSKSALFYFRSIALCHTSTGPTKKFVPIFLIDLLQVLEGCYKVSLEPSLLQAEQLQLSQPFLIAEVLQPSDHFCGPPLDLLQQVHVFPVLRAPELDAGLQVRSHQSGVEGQNDLPQSAGHAAFDAVQDTVGLLGCERTSLACAQLFIHQYLQVLLGRAVLNAFISQPVLILGVAPIHVQDLELGSTLRLTLFNLMTFIQGHFLSLSRSL